LRAAGEVEPFWALLAALFWPPLGDLELLFFLDGDGLLPYICFFNLLPPLYPLSAEPSSLSLLEARSFIFLTLILPSIASEFLKLSNFCFIF